MSLVFVGKFNVESFKQSNNLQPWPCQIYMKSLYQHNIKYIKSIKIFILLHIKPYKDYNHTLLNIKIKTRQTTLLQINEELGIRLGGTAMTDKSNLTPLQIEEIHWFIYIMLRYYQISIYIVIINSKHKNPAKCEIGNVTKLQSN